MKKNIIFFVIIFSIISCSNKDQILSLENDLFKLSIDSKGKLIELLQKNTNENFLVADTSSYLLSIKVYDKIFNPEHAELNSNSNEITLTFFNDTKVVINYEANSNYIKFEVNDFTSDEVELIIWGPYNTKLNKIIGETIGVVQGEDFAIGLQSLNPKTLGGFPWTNNDCMPQINIFAQDDWTDLSEAGKDYVLYRVEAAIPTKYGSSLQAYCRNRNQERIIENLDHEFYLSPKYDDGGIIGSSIAIFGTTKNNILNTISKIEINENLPHPMLEGEWGKTSKAASRAYLIYDFTETTIDKAIELIKKSGLKYLYHGNPFETWGNFELSKVNFPNGIKGLKKCVEKANQNGIQIGIHTLSNFITTNDKYVTPVPDKRLGKVGNSVITEDINESQKNIAIADPKFFDQYKNNNLKTVQIDEELIRYEKVINENGWKLINCERGVFGTNAAMHFKRSIISKLADHGYKVFSTDPELSLEVSKNIAEIFNQTGLRQISFDGLEGNRSTGMGNYGEILFTQNWYNNLDENIKTSLIADASRTTHFFWHLYTRMNWGEPWYAGFRESQTEYRLKNQEYFQRNLMPAMLGWFQLRPETSLEDIEWMLVRSAAYNAGYAFVVSDKSLEENNLSEKILNTIGLWEEVRIENLFSEKQKEKMKDIKNEFRLTKKSNKEYLLQQIHSFKFSYNKKNLQPGQPTFSEFNFTNSVSDSSAEIIISSQENKVKNLVLEFDNFRKIEIPVELQKNEILKLSKNKIATVYTKNWKIRNTIQFSNSDLILSSGNHKLTFNCEIDGNENSDVKIEIRIPDNKETITNIN
ncbi:MAG: hypothetical protein IPM32_16545 [Ignavibacteriae bacterium]|nr:hypothetical protein [Ignavibacteriota bacterium]